MRSTQRVVDLTGESISQPTQQMREAMGRAEVNRVRGGQDPTVAELERRCAERFAKEAAIFLPTLTMANLVAAMHYCRPGDQMLVDGHAHVYLNEDGGITRVGGILPRVLPRIGALPDLDAVAAAVRRPTRQATPIRLAFIENTHNVAGGAVAGPSDLARLRAVLGDGAIPVHADGARVFNAAVAAGVAVADLMADVDSVSVGFNKGLSCPVGSVLVGGRALVEHASEIRRMLGGEMIKAGIVAAAGVVALESMVDRLQDDHDLARALAEVFTSTPGIRLESPVVTNIVRLDTSALAPSQEVADALAAEGVLVVAFDEYVVRAVTHRHVGPGDIDPVREAISRLPDALGRSPLPLSA